LAPPKPAGAAGQQKGSMVQTILLLVALTLVAGGGGAFVGTLIGASPPTSAPQDAFPQKPAETPAEKGRGDPGRGGHGGHGAEEKHADTPKAATPQPVLKLKELAPIVTNLSNPETSWIRLQASILYDTAAVPHPEALAAEVMSDIVGFLRTVSLASIEGAEGLRRLHEDLTDLVVTRSEGHVRELILQGVVVQ
jgi:flagellar protein FliL